MKELWAIIFGRKLTQLIICVSKDTFAAFVISYTCSLVSALSARQNSPNFLDSCSCYTGQNGFYCFWDSLYPDFVRGENHFDSSFPSC